MVADAGSALAAAVAVGRAAGLACDDAVVIAEGYSVRVHLAPAPVVARVPTRAAVARHPVLGWLERELAIAGWLAAQGAPVVAPAPDVDPRVHEHAGLLVTLWEHVTIRPDDPDQASFGAALSDLHAVLRGYPGDLPVLAGAVHDLGWALGRIDDAVAWAAYDRLRGALAPTGPLQPLHGDAHTGNLLVTSSGLRWNDFEDVCRGPVAWDLASATIGAEAVAAYAGAPSAAERATYRDVRRLQVLTALLADPDWFPGEEPLCARLREHFESGTPDI